jgi:hypothetical protein
MISTLIIFTSSSSAEDIIEPEFIMTVDSRMTSDPQPGVEYHVIKDAGGMDADVAERLFRSSETLLQIPRRMLG